MNETKRNEIEKFCDTLTREESIELCKKLIVENNELIAEYEELKAINFILRRVKGISKIVIEKNDSQLKTEIKGGKTPQKGK